MTDEVVFGPASSPPTLEVVINFGVVVGREARDDELQKLGELLASEVPTFAVVAERRREVGPASQANMHQVRVQLDEQAAGSLRSAQHANISAIAERWVRDCQSETTARTLGERLAQTAVHDAQP